MLVNISYMIYIDFSLSLSIGGHRNLRADFLLDVTIFMHNSAHGQSTVFIIFAFYFCDLHNRIQT